MNKFKQYRRTQIAEMREVEPDETLETLRMVGVSVSDEDVKADSPRAGDMIARNPANHRDMWLVAAAYFAVNFEQVEDAQ